MWVKVLVRVPRGGQWARVERVQRNRNPVHRFSPPYFQSRRRTRRKSHSRSHQAIVPLVVPHPPPLQEDHQAIVPFEIAVPHPHSPQHDDAEVRQPDMIVDNPSEFEINRGWIVNIVLQGFEEEIEYNVGCVATLAFSHFLTLLNQRVHLPLNFTEWNVVIEYVSHLLNDTFFICKTKSKSLFVLAGHSGSVISGSDVILLNSLYQSQHPLGNMFSI
uniref:Uncharacterized protein LOC113786678 n=1 Tax=Cicer arietinum TaxID=3827 RepID=A0A3Q7YFH6_CICAR|nr:uncharacterized protein LOC113786678 [Cicer arietinum]